jgi:hypothetical protein
LFTWSSSDLGKKEGEDEEEEGRRIGCRFFEDKNNKMKMKMKIKMKMKRMKKGHSGRTIFLKNTGKENHHLLFDSAVQI